MAFIKVTRGLQEGQTFPIGDGKQTIGRSRDCDIRIEDKAVAEFHASIFREADGKFYIRDSGSGADTIVGGIKVRRTALVNGSSIKIGRTYLSFYMGDTGKREKAVTPPAQKASSQSLHPALQALSVRDEVKKEEKKHKKITIPIFKRFTWEIIGSIALLLFLIAAAYFIISRMHYEPDPAKISIGFDTEPVQSTSGQQATIDDDTLARLDRSRSHSVSGDTGSGSEVTLDLSKISVDNIDFSKMTVGAGSGQASASPHVPPVGGGQSAMPNITGAGAGGVPKMPGLASTGGSSEQAGAPSAAQFAEDQKQAAQPMLAQSGSPSVNIIAPEFSGREQQQEQEEEETKPTPAASDMPKTQEQEQDDKPKDAEDVWDALEESSEDLAEHEEAPDYEDYSDEEIVDALIERQEQLRESAGEDHSMAGDGTGSIDYIFGSGPRRAPKGGCTCEFSIYTMSAQGKPRLRMDSADDILVLWQTPGEVTGRRFNLQGLAKGDEFRVAEAADYSYDGPEISSNPSGVDIEVQEHRGPHGTKACLTVQVFSDGSPQDREILLPSDSFDAGLEPDVAVNAAGDFVIAWQSFRPGAAGWDVYAARFNACGDLQGRPFRVNQYTQGDQVSPSVAVDSKRNFIVVWRSLGQDGDRGGIFGRRFDSSGRTLMPERRINLRPAGDQQHPAVAMNDDGSFIIVWACDNPADKDFWLVGGIYDERGIPLCISH